MKGRLLVFMIAFLTLASLEAQPYFGDTLWAKDYSSTGAFSCSFSPDGSKLAVAYECMGPMVRIIDVNNGNIIWESETPDLCLYNVQFSSNGQYIAIAEELGHLLVIDMTIPDTVYNIDTETGGLNSVDFSSDGMYIYAGGDDGSIKVYETVSGMLHHNIPAAHMGSVLSVDVSNNDHYLVSGGKDNMVVVWDLQNNYQQVHSWMDAMMDFKTVKFTPSADRVLAGNEDNNIYCYNTISGDLDTILQLHMGEVNTIDISTDGSFAISGSNDQSVKMINLYNYGVSYSFTNQLQTRVYGVAISPDMTRMAAANHIGFVIMYNISSLIGIENNNPLIKLKVYPNPATDILYIDGISEPVLYNIITLDGRIIQSGITYHNINVTSLPKGLYTLQIGSGYTRFMHQ